MKLHVDLYIKNVSKAISRIFTIHHHLSETNNIDDTFVDIRDTIWNTITGI